LSKFLVIGQSAEKHANDEREKYLQIYARTHDRFVAFERKQLHQMRRLLTILTSDQHKLLTGSNKFIFLIVNLCFFRLKKMQLIHPKQ
jgi:hypothetical protein